MMPAIDTIVLSRDDVSKILIAFDSLVHPKNYAKRYKALSELNALGLYQELKNFVSDSDKLKEFLNYGTIPD